MLKLVQPPMEEKVYTIQMTESELTDLANLGYYKARRDHPTAMALKAVADELRLPYRGGRRSIVAATAN